MRKYLIYGLSSLVWLASCKKEQAPAPNPTPTPNPTVTETRFPVNLLVDSLMLEEIRATALTNPDVADGVTSIIMSPAASALSRSPQTYLEGNSTNFDEISSQGRDMRALAVRWLYTYRTAPDAAKPYFDKIVANLLAWVNAGNRVANPIHSPNETSYLGFYEAYSVVRSRMTAADRTKVDGWISARATAYRNYPARVNNWETIRLNLVYYFAYILNDQTLRAAADNSYTTLLNVNLMAGGKSEDLINRDAFAYHAYNLLFYARILRVKALYEGSATMQTLKNRKNNINVSLQDMMDYWRPFLINPANNVHLEFVNTQYAPDKTRSDYNKPYVPSSSIYVLEELFYSFPESKNYVVAIQPTAARHNMRLSGFLYWPK
jgi:hypothetical protein